LGDARPADREKMLRWFDARGINAPRRAVGEQQAREKADSVAPARWLAVMPRYLRALWPQVLKDPQWRSDSAEAARAGAKILKPTVASEYPDVNHRIRSLFSWFGSGSGYYGWEDVASQMLLEYSASELVNALQEKTLADTECEGAARFFAGYTPGALFRQDGDTTLIAQLPEELKKTLLEHVAKTGDQDKLRQARKAFHTP
jgi:hypothetical protein